MVLAQPIDPIFDSNLSRTSSIGQPGKFDKVLGGLAMTAGYAGDAAAIATYQYSGQKNGSIVHAAVNGVRGQSGISGVGMSPYSALTTSRNIALPGTPGIGGVSGAGGNDALSIAEYQSQASYANGMNMILASTAMQENMLKLNVTTQAVSANYDTQKRIAQNIRA